MIHISTDYVFSGAFDGTPRPYDIEDATGPLSVYGKTKLAGEREVHAALPNGHVVRTSWVYTGVGSDFVGAMRRLAEGDGPVSVVVDQIGSPTYVADLVAALLQIAERPDGAAAAACRQRGRGEPIRAGAGGVRGSRRGPRTGATRDHRGRAAARAHARRTRRCPAARRRRRAWRRCGRGATRWPRRWPKRCVINGPLPSTP